METRHFSGYAQAMIRAYPHPALNLGGDANLTHLIVVPSLRSRGLAGRVLSIEISQVTEDFTGDVSDAGVRIGDGSDDDKYFDTGLLTLTESVDVGEVLEIHHDGASTHNDIERGRSSVTMTCVAGTTTETGIATVTPVIAWW
jgi:hypothetical protein